MTPLLGVKPGGGKVFSLRVPGIQTTVRIGGVVVIMYFVFSLFSLKHAPQVPSRIQVWDDQWLVSIKFIALITYTSSNRYSGLTPAAIGFAYLESKLISEL